MKKLLLIIVLLVVGYQWSQHHDLSVIYSDGSNASTPHSNATTSHPLGDDALAAAYSNQQNNVQVHGKGVVAKVLPDDNEGSRHQRFIVRLASGQSILIAHNIDLAPRVEQLSPDEPIEFSGEYEWNNKGGVVHWTHRDPAGRHLQGSITYRGKTYQ